jgi:hypothetical protein
VEQHKYGIAERRDRAGHLEDGVRMALPDVGRPRAIHVVRAHRQAGIDALNNGGKIVLQFFSDGDSDVQVVAVAGEGSIVAERQPARVQTVVDSIPDGQRVHEWRVLAGRDVGNRDADHGICLQAMLGERNTVELPVERCVRDPVRLGFDVKF